jgi:hypothetical protein
VHTTLTATTATLAATPDASQLSAADLVVCLLVIPAVTITVVFVAAMRYEARKARRARAAGFAGELLRTFPAADAWRHAEQARRLQAVAILTAWHLTAARQATRPRSGAGVGR